MRISIPRSCDGEACSLTSPLRDEQCRMVSSWSCQTRERRPVIAAKRNPSKWEYVDRVEELPRSSLVQCAFIKSRYLNTLKRRREVAGRWVHICAPCATLTEDFSRAFPARGRCGVSPRGSERRRIADLARSPRRRPTPRQSPTASENLARLHEVRQAPEQQS